MSSIEDEVCEDMKNHNNAKSDVGEKAVENLVEKMQERAKMGHEKYGTTMDRKDLTETEWETHLQEELMDAAIYMTKLRTLNTEKWWFTRISGGLYWMIIRQLIIMEMDKLADK